LRPDHPGLDSHALAHRLVDEIAQRARRLTPEDDWAMPKWMAVVFAAAMGAFFGFLFGVLV